MIVGVIETIKFEELIHRINIVLIKHDYYLSISSNYIKVINTLLF